MSTDNASTPDGLTINVTHVATQLVTQTSQLLEVLQAIVATLGPKMTDYSGVENAINVMRARNAQLLAETGQ